MCYANRANTFSSASTSLIVTPTYVHRFNFAPYSIWTMTPLLLIKELQPALPLPRYLCRLIIICIKSSLPLDKQDLLAFVVESSRLAENVLRRGNIDTKTSPRTQFLFTCGSVLRNAIIFVKIYVRMFLLSLYSLSMSSIYILYVYTSTYIF